MSRCKQVLEFHEKHHRHCWVNEDLSTPVPEPPVELADEETLKMISQVVNVLAQRLRGHRELRMNRAHYVLEECAEFIAALAKRDEVEVLDALADLEYVTVGTAVTFGLPLEEAFDEVHRSNMTKTPSGPVCDGHPKGPSYEPPDLARIIREHKEK